MFLKLPDEVLGTYCINIYIYSMFLKLPDEVLGTYCIYIYIYIYVSLYLYVPDEGSLLPKYRDFTTSNDFELYLMCCGVMLQ